MRLRRVILLVATSVVGCVAVLLFADYWSRCHGKPLSREEAIQRATIFVADLSRDLVIGDTPLSLVAEQYDPGHKSWMLTFQNKVCVVHIISDRCDGNDIGGTTCMTKGEAVRRKVRRD